MASDAHSERYKGRQIPEGQRLSEYTLLFELIFKDP
jgi:hypothetical protein